jgi:hypothetical protein
MARRESRVEKPEGKMKSVRQWMKFEEVEKIRM